MPFTDDMNIVLSAANLVVSRAGAGAIAEIIRCRVPSILVPYPYAADNHQLLNANYLEAKGGAIVCEDHFLENRFFLKFGKLCLMRNLGYSSS